MCELLVANSLNRFPWVVLKSYICIFGTTDAQLLFSIPVIQNAISPSILAKIGYVIEVGKESQFGKNQHDTIAFFHLWIFAIVSPYYLVSNIKCSGVYCSVMAV